MCNSRTGAALFLQVAALVSLAMSVHAQATQSAPASMLRAGNRYAFSPLLHPGARVRLTITEPSASTGAEPLPVDSHSRLEGTLVAVENASLRLQLVGGKPDTVQIPGRRVFAVEMHARSGRCVLETGTIPCSVTGMIIGTFIGGSVGMMAGRRINHDSAPETGRDVGMLAGAALLGTMFPRIGRDQWIQLDPPRASP